jgi:hypothetical protein
MTHVIAIAFIILTHLLFLPELPAAPVILLCLSIEAHRFIGQIGR